MCCWSDKRGAGPGGSAAAQPLKARAAHAGPHLHGLQIQQAHTIKQLAASAQPASSIVTQAASLRSVT
jgi:hypothetical protein